MCVSVKLAAGTWISGAAADWTLGPVGGTSAKKATASAPKQHQSTLAVRALEPQEPWRFRVLES